MTATSAYLNQPVRSPEQAAYDRLKARWSQPKPMLKCRECDGWGFYEWSNDPAARRIRCEECDGHGDVGDYRSFDDWLESLPDDDPDLMMMNGEAA